MTTFLLSAFADEIADDLKTQMDVLERHGIQHIEMRGVNGKNLVQHSLPEVREIRKQLQERGFHISAVGSPIGKIGITEDFRPHLDLFKHTLEIAKLLETKYIRMFSFFIPAGEDPEACRTPVMERWQQFIRAAEGSGLILLHENEKDIYGDTAERCLDLIKTMDCPYLKLTFDPANFVQCNVESYPHAFQLLQDHIEYMHIKDALYKDHSVAPAGYGDGKLGEIIRSLHARGYEGFLSLEPHLSSFTGFADLEQDKAKRLPTGNGPEKFAVSLEALNKILNGIHEFGEEKS